MVVRRRGGARERRRLDAGDDVLRKVSLLGREMGFCEGAVSIWSFALTRALTWALAWMGIDWINGVTRNL